MTSKVQQETPTATGTHQPCQARRRNPGKVRNLHFQTEIELAAGEAQNEAATVGGNKGISANPAPSQFSRKGRGLLAYSVGAVVSDKGRQLNSAV